MPHTSSAKKHLRQDEKRRRYNRAIMKGIKKQLKTFDETAASGTVEELRTQYNTTAKLLDKAAARNVIHTNLAARKKSQLAHAVNVKAKPAS